MRTTFLHWLCKVLVFSTRPVEFPGVVLNALVNSCSLGKKLKRTG